MQVHKLNSRATTHGQEFEYKLAALLFVRLKQRPELRFELATNVVGADPFDDLLLRLNWSDENNTPRRITYLVQLKHGKPAKTYQDNPFIRGNSHYNIRKYFQIYKKLGQLVDGMDDKTTKRDTESNEDYIYLHKVEEYRFIIYTNNTFNSIKTGFTDKKMNPPELSSCPLTPQNNLQLDDYFPHCELLTSPGEEVSYIFSEKDTGVWKLLKGNALEEAYQREFLPRLQVLSGQPDSAGLDDPIANELKTLFKLSETQNRRVFQKYLDRAKKWWESDDGEVWTNETSVLEDILIEDISRNFLEAMSRHPFHDFRFSAESCEDLAKQIRRQRISIVSIPGAKPEIRCLKALQVLLSEFGKKIMLLDEKSLIQNLYAIKFILGKNTDDLTILINIKVKKLDVLRQIQEICQNSVCKILIICSSAEEILRSFSFVKDTCEVKDFWSLDQFASEDQSQMLELDVNFQGRHVTLRELEAAWPTLRQDVDGPFLCALAEGSAVLGDTLTPRGGTGESDELYMPRVIEHRWELKREVLLLETDSDMFALSGFPECLLKEIKSEEMEQEIRHKTWYVLSNEEYVLNPLNDEEKLRRIVDKFPTKNIHHIAYSKNCYIWLSSRGSHEHILPFFIRRSDLCNTENPVCQHREDDTDFSMWSGQAFYLSGQPGAGKSTFLAHLAKKVPEVDMCVFIPLSRLNEFFWSIGERRADLDTSQVIRLLAEAVKAESCSSPDTTKKFLQQCLNHTGNVSIFVDGVDEICPRYKEVALNLLKLLMKFKYNELWVSSRNHLDHYLRKLFTHEPLHLRLFSEEEQVDYICRFVSQEDGQEYAEELRNNVSETVESAKKFTKRQGQEGFIFDMPLHTYLFAQSYKELSVMFDEANRKPLLLFLKLYRKFISERVRIYMKKMGISLDSPNSSVFQSQINRMHEECALSALGLDCFLQKDCIKTYMQDYKEDNTGILYFSETGPVFMHYSFAEFFCANWVSNNLEKMKEESWENVSSLSRTFLNAILANHITLHEAVILGKTEKIRSEIGCIHDLDKGGRSALHLASIEGNVEACHLLLAAGVNATIEDKVLNWSALQYADDARHLAVVDVLLGSGSKIYHAKRTIEENVTSKGHVFRRAAAEGHLNIINLFARVKKLSMMNKRQKIYFQNNGAADSVGRTPLHIAASRGHKAVVECLINSGASVNETDLTGITPLHLASKYEHENVVELLLSEGAWVNALNDEGYIPLHFACEWGCEGIVELLLAQGSWLDAVSIEEKSPLYYACELGHQGIVELLLAKGARVNAVDEAGRSPLHSACWGEHQGIVELLLAKGASVNAVNEEGKSPLYFACVNGHQGIVKLLLAQGASVGAVDSNGESLVHYARRNGHQVILDLLIAK